MLGDCIVSVGFCREIVIVDSGSTDGTLELVEAYADAGYPIRLIRRRWEGFARQKQFALEQATSPWCLSIDADERVDDDLARVLARLDLSAENGVDGWRMRRRDYLPGYGYTPAIVSTKSILRLVRRGKARFDMRKLVHESIELEGASAELKGGTLLHFRDIPLEEEARKANDYAVLKARQRIAEGKSPSLLKLVCNPFARFASAYFLQRYFLCGRAGFVYAGVLGYYTFLTEANHYRLSVQTRRA
jgi:glycosyltransferase involved in cell wall biosynthesis